MCLRMISDEGKMYHIPVRELKSLYPGIMCNISGNSTSDIQDILVSIIFLLFFWMMDIGKENKNYNKKWLTEVADTYKYKSLSQS